MNNKDTKKWFLTSAILIVFVGVSIGGIMYYYKEKEKERQMEARFDKFMWYHYPYLKDISTASDTYKRMLISLMYDYLANHKGRYIYENVHFCNGGVFSMREFCSLEDFLNQTGMIYAGQAFFPIEAGPNSRNDEKAAFYTILNSVKSLMQVDIYDSNIGLSITPEQIENVIDSLNMEIQNNFYKFNKYKNPNSKRNLNSIRESDYDLKNY